MLEANTSAEWLPLYEALASEVRLNIIRTLAERSLNIKQLAQHLELSSAIVTMHVKKLEKAGLIETKMVRKDGGTHKMCMLIHQQISIHLLNEQQKLLNVHEATIPVGHYTACEVNPTCGIATSEKIIGQFDDARYFHHPERMNAGILWLGHGYVEYTTPNYLLSSQQPDAIEFTLEIGSEAPGYNEQWPSDIYFAINGIEIGFWTSPGDYGAERGRFAPNWWGNYINQHGLLKTVRIDKQGTWIDGEKMSDLCIEQIPLHSKSWNLKIGVKEDAHHVGGLTIFGKGFGHYSKDIHFRVYYHYK